MEEEAPRPKGYGLRFSLRMWIVLTVAVVVLITGVAISGFAPNFLSTGNVVKNPLSGPADSESVSHNGGNNDSSISGSDSAGGDDGTGDSSVSDSSVHEASESSGECSSFSETVKRRMIVDIIALRKAAASGAESGGKLSDVAERVSSLDKRFQCIGDSRLSDRWNIVVGCAYEGCPSNDYLRLIDEIALRSDSREGNLTHQLIRTESYWNGKNMDQFYNAVSTTERLVSRYNDDDVSSSWEALLDCNEGCASCKCDSFYDRLFNCIRLINE